MQTTASIDDAFVAVFPNAKQHRDAILDPDQVLPVELAMQVGVVVNWLRTLLAVFAVCYDRQLDEAARSAAFDAAVKATTQLPQVADPLENVRRRRLEDLIRQAAFNASYRFGDTDNLTGIKAFLSAQSDRLATQSVNERMDRAS